MFLQRIFSLLITCSGIITIIDPKDIKMGKLPGKPFIQTDYSNSARVSELCLSFHLFLYSLSANPTKWSNILKQIADEWFQCV